MEQIPVRLRKLRLEREMTQDDLAQQLHVTRQAVSNWETGKTVVGIEYLMKLSELYGVSVDELLHGERAVEPETYPHNQRKYAVCITACAAVFLVCALLNIAVKPRLLHLYYNEFVFRPYFWYRQITAAVMASAAGVMLPAAVSLSRDIRLWGRWKRLALVLAPLCLVPVAAALLQSLGWLPFPAGGVWDQMGWFLGDIWWNLKFYRELFFFSSACFFLGMNR